MKFAFFVRHGEALDGKFTELGRVQSEHTAGSILEVLKKAGITDMSRVMVVTSSYDRARISGDIIYNTLNGGQGLLASNVTICEELNLCGDETSERDKTIPFSVVKRARDVIIIVTHYPNIKFLSQIYTGSQLSVTEASGFYIQGERWEDIFQKGNQSFTKIECAYNPDPKPVPTGEQEQGPLEEVDSDHEGTAPEMDFDLAVYFDEVDAASQEEDIEVGRPDSESLDLANIYDFYMDYDEDPLSDGKPRAQTDKPPIDLREQFADLENALAARLQGLEELFGDISDGLNSTGEMHAQLIQLVAPLSDQVAKLSRMMEAFLAAASAKTGGGVQAPAQEITGHPAGGRVIYVPDGVKKVTFKF